VRTPRSFRAQKTAFTTTTLQVLIPSDHQRTFSSTMGGPGSGGYKNAPGDTETHAAWEVTGQEDGNTQVHVIALEGRKRGLMQDRNYHKYDASTVLGKWRSTLPASEHIYLNAENISTR
jgi:hypothetical protein